MENKYKTKLMQNKRVNAKSEREYPTVKDMLKYIKDNHIPMDAIVVTEHLHDFYLTENGWEFFYVPGGPLDGPSIMLPAHNHFGSIGENKEFFAIWMHY